MLKPKKWVTDSRTSGISGRSLQVSKVGNLPLRVCKILESGTSSEKRKNTVGVGEKNKKRSTNYFSKKKAKKLEVHPSKKETQCNTDGEIPSWTNWTLWKADLNREKGKNALSKMARGVHCLEQMLLGNMDGGKILMLSWKIFHPNEKFHFSHSALPKIQRQALQTHGKPTGKPQTLKTARNQLCISITWSAAETSDSPVTSWRWGWTFVSSNLVLQRRESFRGHIRSLLQDNCNFPWYWKVPGSQGSLIHTSSENISEVPSPLF